MLRLNVNRVSKLSAEMHMSAWISTRAEGWDCETVGTVKRFSTYIG